MPQVRQLAQSLIAPPNPMQFRCEEFKAKTEFKPHRHSWGQLMWVTSGIMVLNVAGQRFLAPPEFVLWAPAGLEHSCSNRALAQCRLMDIKADWCTALPQQPCLLSVSAIFRAIVEDFYRRKQFIPASEQDLRLCQVLIDQLLQAPVQQTYLPSSEDKLLSPILQELEQNPADNTPLAVWASRVYTTERTLSRRCKQALGMSFSEWRQRLRFLHAASLLEQGKSIQDVALDMGYSSSSAFIVMFQKIAGTSPERFRRLGQA